LTDNTPKISVIIPAYNAAKWIRRAIDSALGQRLSPIEIIVVDDGSSDDTSEVCMRYGEQIRLIQQENAGAAAARNRGVAEARGDWIAFLDADDEWLPHRLEAQWMLLQKHPDILWAAGAYAVYRGGKCRFVRNLPKDIPWQDGSVDAYALLGAGSGIIWTGTVLLRREVWNDIGGMDTNLRESEDRDMWLNVASRCRDLVYVTEPVARYHVLAATNLTSTTIARRDLSSVKLARKHMATLSSLPPDAQTAVRAHLRDSLIGLASAAIQQGVPDMARTVIAEIEELGLGPIPVSLQRSLRIPAWIWIAQWQMRTKLRQWFIG